MGQKQTSNKILDPKDREKKNLEEYKCKILFYEVSKNNFDFINIVYWICIKSFISIYSHYFTFF